MLSAFGTFQIRNKSERIGRNPKTGEEARIKRRRVVTFKPSHILKTQVSRAHRTRCENIKVKVAQIQITG
jgi:integration host factor subunit alpha